MYILYIYIHSTFTINKSNTFGENDWLSEEKVHDKCVIFVC